MPNKKADRRKLTQWLLTLFAAATFPISSRAFSDPASSPLGLSSSASAVAASNSDGMLAAAPSSPHQQPQRPQWTVNGYSPEFGVYIGPLRAAEEDKSGANAAPGRPRPAAILGHVFAINESALQVVNCTFGGDVPDTFFWLDHTEVPTRNGLRLSTFEFGLSPLGRLHPNQPILLVLPDQEEQLRFSQFRSLSLFSLNGDFSLGTVKIPENMTPPKTQLLPDELRGTRYDVQSGPIQIVDTRTIKIFGFIFQGDKAPDGYFYVGRGLNVSKESGVKAAIRGRDTFQLISPMNERYTGGKDIFVELPDGYDVHHIDWLSVYCLRFEVDYGHIFIRNISPMIPPHFPDPTRFEEELEPFREQQWHLSNLLGTESQLNFTFQLGPPGQNRGYKSIMQVARPPKYVWYVNGYLAELYLKRGIAYTFIVEGGHNGSVPELNNPLYLTDSPYGGYAKLSNEERQNAVKFTQEEAGRLCRWLEISESTLRADADQFNSFVDYRDTLRLECDQSDQPAYLTFMPGKDTPDTLYYGSLNNYQMGGRIHVVDQFPADLKDIVVEPYRYDAKRHQEKMELTRENAAASIRHSMLLSLLINPFFAMAALFIMLF